MSVSYTHLTDGGDKNIKIAILDTEVVFEADDSYIKASMPVWNTEPSS